MNHTYTGTRSPIVSLAMAGVLETLSVPRASALLSASLPPVARSNSIQFSEFQGLKIQPIRALVKLSSTRKLARRGSRIEPKVLVVFNLGHKADSMDTFDALVTALPLTKDGEEAQLQKISELQSRKENQKIRKRRSLLAKQEYPEISPRIP
ncbi:hypothetical protein ACS0TY_021255 [Phlomoides rotata]